MRSDSPADLSFCLVLPSGAGGELQTYQIRTATASSSLPQPVVANSQLKLDDPTMKREIRLAKNRQAFFQFCFFLVKVNFLFMTNYYFLFESKLFL